MNQTVITFGGKDIVIPRKEAKPNVEKRKFGNEISNVMLKPFEKQVIITEILKLEEKQRKQRFENKNIGVPQENGAWLNENIIKNNGMVAKRTGNILCGELKCTSAGQEQEQEHEHEHEPTPDAAIEYKDDIFSYLIELENEECINHNYMPMIQNDINDKMRSVLIDWWTEVHLKFKFLQETLFITINIIDRYLSKRRVSRDKLQLVGITAWMIAGKYEEIYPPEVKTYVYITYNSHSKQDILKMEYEILATLDFNITIPSALRYAELIQLNMGYTDRQKYKMNYWIELGMLDYSMIKYTYFTKAIASAIVCDESQRDKILDICETNYWKVKKCVEDWKKIWTSIKEGVYSYTAIVKKYSTHDFHWVSKIGMWVV